MWPFLTKLLNEVQSILFIDYNRPFAFFINRLIALFQRYLIMWFTITSRSQSPRALFQILQPPNSITPLQHKKIYRFLYRSLPQRSPQPPDKFVHCAQPCRTSYNTVNPTDRPTRHPLQPTFYLAVVIQPPSVQLNPIHPIQRVPFQPIHMSF